MMKYALLAGVLLPLVGTAACAREAAGDPPAAQTTPPADDGFNLGLPAMSSDAPTASSDGFNFASPDVMDTSSDGLNLTPHMSVSETVAPLPDLPETEILADPLAVPDE